MLDGSEREFRRRRYPKLSIMADCETHLICSVRTGRGPTADIDQMKDTLRTKPSTVKVKLLLGDAGYDSEFNHRHAREELKIETLFPPWHGRPSSKPAKGKYRRQMQEKFRKTPKVFGQRWQVETVFSMLKRNLGAALSGRTFWTQCRDLWIKVLTHNIAITAQIT